MLLSILVKKSTSTYYIGAELVILILVIIDRLTIGNDISSSHK